jgi:hypothetical protein
MRLFNEDSCEVDDRTGPAKCGVERGWIIVGDSNHSAKIADL